MCIHSISMELQWCRRRGAGGGATAPPLLKVGGGGGGGHCPLTLGHDCTLKFNEEKISSCSMSATVGIPIVSIKGIAS